jgi:hypothetical protein
VAELWKHSVRQIDHGVGYPRYPQQLKRSAIVYLVGSPLVQSTQSRKRLIRYNSGWLI